MKTPSRLKGLLKLGGRAALFTAPLWVITAPLAADWYDGRPPYTHPNEVASQLSPYDPAPEIGFRNCQFSECPSDRHGDRHPSRGPALPGILGNETLLVNCGASHSEPRRGMFNSLNQAVSAAPPNATILILPPGQGTTCVESVHVHRPLTIATYGSGGRAVIQPDPREPCLVADIPLGDALVIDGVRFIARSAHKPCVTVEAGHVVMRNSSVDSRGSAWAFDVHESAELTIDSTRIETDASAVHARRARVDIRNLDIDIDGRNGTAVLDLGRTDCIDRDGGTVHGSVGLALECSEGSVEGGSIIGGAVAVMASAGTRGLRITDLKISKPDTGILLLPGQLGSVNLERPVIVRARDGIIVAPGAESQITGAVITDSLVSGISVYGAGTLISGNKIVGAADGIALLADGAFPPAISADIRGTSVIGDAGDGMIVENNLIANVKHAGVRVDGRVGNDRLRLHGKLIGNTVYARSPAVCIDDRYNDDPVHVRANMCNREWLPWPF